MPEAIYSTKLNAGGKTYFFDVRETQSGDKYLQITESRLKQDGEKYRSNIVIFKEHFNEFRQVLEEIAKKL
jgi:phage-related protein